MEGPRGGDGIGTGREIATRSSVCISLYFYASRLPMSTWRAWVSFPFFSFSKASTSCDSRLAGDRLLGFFSFFCPAEGMVVGRRTGRSLLLAVAFRSVPSFATRLGLGGVAKKPFGIDGFLLWDFFFFFLGGPLNFSSLSPSLFVGEYELHLNCSFGIPISLLQHPHELD
ncbi:hypothetical protein BT93_B2293 [Corymbia citriodora subsp. variegata]|nr:hypothetical protein BT93_B2293 [Corymbia citriodora subsp. variegata]